MDRELAAIVLVALQWVAIVLLLRKPEPGEQTQGIAADEEGGGE